MKKILLILVLILIILAILITFILIKSTDLKYEVLSKASLVTGTKDGKSRGDELVEMDNDYYLIIYYGEVSVNYSSIEVYDIISLGNNVIVKVRLPENDGFGDAFSYPKAIIKFNNKPNILKIIYH